MSVLCVLPYVTLGEATPEYFEQSLKDDGFTVKFLEEYTDKEGHPNILFELLDNMGRFCIYRISTGMKWADDWYENHPCLMPEEIIAKYNID